MVVQLDDALMLQLHVRRDLFLDVRDVLLVRATVLHLNLLNPPL